MPPAGPSPQKSRSPGEALRPIALIFIAIIGVIVVVALRGAFVPRPTIWAEPSAGIEFVDLPAGSFVMGSPADEPGRETRETPHTVALGAFALGRFEVTQGQWKRVMGANPSHFKDRGDSFPVERVNFEDVSEFLRRLNAGKSKWTYRLPTEAEWEYACRAGTKTAFNTGSTLSAAAASIREDGVERGTKPVGSFPPNVWGLHDMHGNVWEWTLDDSCPYPDGPAVSPRAECASGLKVIRGGSWYFGPDSARSALRYTHPPRELGFSLGFRVVAVRQ